MSDEQFPRIPEVPPSNTPPDPRIKRFASWFANPRRSRSFGKTLDLTKLLAGPCPKIPWIIPNMISEQDIIVFSGAGGVGKSYLLMELALALAQGRPFLYHFPVPRAYRVLYLDLEMPETDIQRRFWRMVRGSGIAAAPPEFTALSGVSFRLAAEDPQIEQFAEMILDLRPELIMIDSVRRIVLGDENSSETADRLFEMMKLFRNTLDVSFNYLHHWRKASKDGQNGSMGDRMRGSSAWRDNCDAHFAVEQPKRDYLLITPDKSRHSDGLEDPFFVKFDKGGSEERDCPFRLIYEETPDEVLAWEKIRRMLEQFYPTGVEEKSIIVQTKLSRKIVRTRLDWGLSQGILRASEGRPRLYQLNLDGPVPSVPA